MRNLFLIHTAFQKFVAERLIASDPDFSQAENILLLEMDPASAEIVTPELWASVMPLEPLGYSVLGKERHAAAERNMARILDLMPPGETVRILISDIAWPMNNRVFFDRRLRRRVEFNFIIDGIGSYNGARFTPKLFLRNLGKFGLGLLGRAVRYTPYVGQVMGEEHPRVKRVYGFASEHLSSPPEKRTEIRYQPTALQEVSERTCLFLDQPYGETLSPEQWKAIQEQTRSFLLSLGCQTYYYKRHRLSTAEDEAFYAQAGFQVVDSKRCVEELFHELGASIVVSYNSSALFNIKIFYGSETRCISYCSDTLARLTMADAAGIARIKTLFRTVGVDLVEGPLGIQDRALIPY
ncbi:hypothetical protein D3C86_911230 [compost metagenome]